MKKKNEIAPNLLHDEIDRRERLSKLHVLVADRNHSTATMVQRILFTFGFRNMDITTNGDSALALLRSRPFDLIITEWNMDPVDGVAMVKAIRHAKDDARIPRDIPIIMLTSRADEESVNIARDAGINEFIAKPFSAKAIISRMQQIIDNPRAFIQAPEYIGPDRRRRGQPPQGMSERRQRRDEDRKKYIPQAHNPKQLQFDIFTTTEILQDMAHAEAKAEALQSINTLIDWARNDVPRLESALKNLTRFPNNYEACIQMKSAAAAVKAQAEVFGYPLGIEVTALMIEYLTLRQTFTHDNLLVLSKHVDTIRVVFREKVRENGQAIAIEMMDSLRQLIRKLG